MQSARADAAMGDDLGFRRGAGGHEARRGRCAGDARRRDGHAAGLDLPAVLRALSDKGITRLMVEGGARVASSFVAAGLVDEIWLLRGPETVGADGIAALDALPLSAHHAGRPRFRVRASESLGKDTLTIYERVVMFTGIVTDIGEIVSLDADGAGPVAPPAHRLPLRPDHHRRRRLDRLQRRLPDRGGLRRRRRQDLVRRRCRRRDARHDHGETLAQGHQSSISSAR